MKKINLLIAFVLLLAAGNVSAFGPGLSATKNFTGGSSTSTNVIDGKAYVYGIALSSGVNPNAGFVQLIDISTANQPGYTFFAESQKKSPAVSFTPSTVTVSGVNTGAVVWNFNVDGSPVLFVNGVYLFKSIAASGEAYKAWAVWSK